MPSHRLARICTKGRNGRDREMDTKASRRARSDRCGYLKRTFRDFTVPTIRIYRPQCMQHSTIDEDVSRSLTRAATHIASRSRREWHLRVRERTCDARLYLRIDIASRLVRTDTFCEDISGKGPKEGDSRRLNHPPVAGTPKPNAKDDKTQFELKTALL